MLRLVAAALAACLCFGLLAPLSAQAQTPTLSDSGMEPATVEYDGDLPPLLDRQVFFGDPQLSGAQLSPNGEFLAFRQEYKGVMNVWMKGVDEPFDAAQPVTADTTRPVRGYFWSNDSQYILYNQDKGGDENFHVYAVDLDAERTEMGVPPARDLTPVDGIQARIYSVPESQPGVVYVGMNDRDKQWHDVYRVDIETGERELIRENTQQIAGWTFDLDGNLRLGQRVAQDGSTEILDVSGGAEGEVVYTCTVEESCGAVRFHKDGEEVYMTTNKGDRDLTELILFNPDTQEETVIEGDPEGEVDFGGAEFHETTDELIATYYVGDRLRIYPKDDAFASILETLKSKLPDGEIYLGTSTEDFTRHIVSVTRDVDPGVVFLFNSDTGDVEQLYRSRPELPSEHLASMEPIRYEARDGLEIPAYLTTPQDVEAKNLPLVVVVHGGPWARDTWGYDSYAQFLANRGYAVLQPNFRASTGYGKAFLNAGNGKWGDEMQDDITDGVQYLIDEGIADPDRVAIFGGSYGGYATLAGLAFTPDVYSAGISFVGPSNLITLLEAIPPYWEAARRVFNTRMGDLDNPEDVERLKRQSPLFSADQIDDALLVVQGANDPRVPQRESDQIVVAARENDAPVGYIVAPDEGHGFAKENNRLAFAAEMEAFLAAHVGGRHQTSMTGDIEQRLSEITVDPSTVEMPEASGEEEASKTSALPDADGSVLQPANVTYETSLSIQGRTINLTTDRSIATAMHDGQEVWQVVDKVSSPMLNATDSLMLDRATLRPVARTAKGQGTITLSYADDAITGSMQMGSQSMDINKELDAPVLAGGSGLEMTLATLPLEDGYATTMRVFNYQQQSVRRMKVAVTGTSTVEVGAGSFDTMTLEVTSLDGNDAGTGTYHVMADAPHHVVKAEQKLGAQMGGGTATVELTAVGSGE